MIRPPYVMPADEQVIALRAAIDDIKAWELELSLMGAAVFSAAAPAPAVA